jgi:hypothetical protein
MYLIPVYGVAYFPFVVFWRLVYLPLKDWPLRPEEAADLTDGHVITA